MIAMVATSCISLAKSSGLGILESAKFFQSGENGLRVQVIRRGHSHDIEIRKLAQDVHPRLIAMESARLVTREFLESSGCLLR